MLNWLHSGLLDAGEVSPAADIAQLRGLTERMDDDAFLPFTSEQLTGDAPRVVCQICRVIDAAVSRLANDSLAERTRIAGREWSQYWYYFWSGGYLWALMLSPYEWQKSGTPVWLMVAKDLYAPAPDANDSLAPLARAVPAKFFVEANGWGYVRIDLPPGQEFDDVVSSVVAQVREALTLVGVATV